MLRQQNYVKLIQLLLIVVLIYFSFLPILSVIIYGLSGDLSFIDEKLVKRVTTLLANSLFVSVTVTIISVFFGIIITFALRRINFKGIGILRVLILLPMVNPTFVGSIAFIMLFGSRGLITHKLLNLSVSPYGWQGIVTLQVMSLVTYAYLLISSSIQNIDTTIEQAARNLGASESSVLFKITLPMMAPEITSAALLVFLSSMSDFTTPIMIGGKFGTLASDLYVQITGVYNMRSAAISGIILLIPCVIAFYTQRYFSNKKKYFSDTSNDRDIVYEKVSTPVKFLLISCTLCFIGFFILKFAFIIIGAFTQNWGYDYTFTLEHVKKALSTNLNPFLNSVKLAIITAFIASLSGVILSYLINRKKIVFSAFVDFIGVFPAAVPGILFGIGYLVTFKYPLFGVGKYIFSNSTPWIILGTSIIIYLICIARSMNVAMKSGYALLEHIDPDIENAAYNLGAGKIKTFKLVIMPLLKEAVLTSYLKIFSSTITTLGAIIFLILPKNKVAVQIIFQSGTQSAMGVPSTLALMLSMLTLSFMGLFYVIVYGKQILEKLRRCSHYENKTRKCI